MSSSLTPFDSKSYYRFSNAAYTGVTISTGYKNSGATIGFTPSGSRSSENWQIHLQAGRYFIRNYDYGAGLQLGLTESSRAIPQLLPRSGDLGQQWFLSQLEDGTWRVTNGLLGNSSMLGVSDEISGAAIAPGMNPSPDGSEKWIVTVNLSAGEIIDPLMLNDVSDVKPILNKDTSTASSRISPTTTFPSATFTSKSNISTETTPFLSGARPMHAPTRFYSCTTAGVYVALSSVILFLVAVGLVWNRRTRDAYHLVPSSDSTLGVDVPLTEK